MREEKLGRIKAVSAVVLKNEQNPSVDKIVSYYEKKSKEYKTYQDGCNAEEVKEFLKESNFLAESNAVLSGNYILKIVSNEEAQKFAKKAFEELEQQNIEITTSSIAKHLKEKHSVKINQVKKIFEGMGGYEIDESEFKANPYIRRVKKIPSAKDLSNPNIPKKREIPENFIAVLDSEEESRKLIFTAYKHLKNKNTQITINGILSIIIDSHKKKLKSPLFTSQKFFESLGFVIKDDGTIFLEGKNDNIDIENKLGDFA